MADSRQAAALLARCGRDMAALEELYLLYKGQVFAYAFSMLRDYALAEDVLHEVFLRLTKSAPRYKGKSSALTYILGITKNTARELRRKQRNPLPLREDLPNEQDSTAHTELRALLDALADNQRQVVVLHLYAGLTFGEIARLLHTPESTLKSRWQKALEILRKEIKEGDL